MVTFHVSHASDSSSTALSWVWVLIYWRIFLNVSSTLSFGPSLYAMLQREFLFMLLSVCQQYSTITCYLMIPSLWWGASVSSVLLIKFQSYKGTVPGPQGYSLLSVPVLLWGAVLGPLQIFAPLVKKKLFCFLCALPPDAGEAFPIALSKIVCVAFSQQFKTFIMKRCQARRPWVVFYDFPVAATDLFPQACTTRGHFFWTLINLFCDHWLSAYSRAWEQLHVSISTICMYLHVSTSSQILYALETHHLALTVQ